MVLDLDWSQPVMMEDGLLYLIVPFFWEGGLGLMKADGNDFKRKIRQHYMGSGRRSCSTRK